MDGEPTDTQLLARLRQDTEALRAFYLRHVDAVTGFLARRCRTPDDLADAVAQTFVEVIGSASRTTPPGETRRPGCSASPPTPPRPSGGNNSVPPHSPPQSRAAVCWTRMTMRGSMRPGCDSRWPTHSAPSRPPSERSWSSSTSTGSPLPTQRASSASILLHPACDSRAGGVACALRSPSRHRMPSRFKEVDDERHRR